MENDLVARYLTRQLNNFFPDECPVSVTQVLELVNLAEQAVTRCFSNLPAPFNEATKHLDVLHTDQYSMLLYILSRHAFLELKNDLLATKMYCLNKTLHSIDVFYTTALPSVFKFTHPLGTVLGRASFADYFTVYQGCTVGCMAEQRFPEFSGPITMYANSKILGHCRVGANVLISNGVSVINTDIPDNVIVFGSYPNYVFKKFPFSVFDRPPYHYD